ncbi:ChbG/HpnK family deacetylase [Blastococcus sp. TF02A-26]|uniref:ChbG/HpnK family deacetylase n=1 Tax=Blastococcus sp. TF02A-26 TaxID=2250577 RepID=UPI000DEB56B9|nr:ChbG/HpnK family deacetylase [Blastococcus sp. TF02A-26]RBY79029.1 hypothetical protein DQ240_22780 [Blastococcus sp. TF02A-26]
MHSDDEGSLAGPSSSELLGFPRDARVLIVNCDDLGLHEAVNAAVVEAVNRGVASSASLMVPAPAAAHAMGLLAADSDLPFGVHLTLTRDGPAHRWAPVAPAEQVPSLVGADGLLLPSAAVPELLAGARIEDVERELRTQLAVVARAGLSPTHLDWHVMADGGRDDIRELTVQLALEHGLAARVWLRPGRQAARARGLPVVDHDFLDSFALPLQGKAERYVRLVRALPTGLSEWAVHPAVDPTPVDVDLDWAVRRSDYDFLISAEADRVLADEAVMVIDYRRLQRAWAGNPGATSHRS